MTSRRDCNRKCSVSRVNQAADRDPPAVKYLPPTVVYSTIMHTPACLSLSQLVAEVSHPVSLSAIHPPPVPAVHVFCTNHPFSPVVRYPASLADFQAVPLAGRSAPPARARQRRPRAGNTTKHLAPPPTPAPRPTDTDLGGGGRKIR